MSPGGVDRKRLTIAGLMVTARHRLLRWSFSKVTGPMSYASASACQSEVCSRGLSPKEVACATQRGREEGGGRGRKGEEGGGRGRKGEEGGGRGRKGEEGGGRGRKGEKKGGRGRKRGFYCAGDADAERRRG